LDSKSTSRSAEIFNVYFKQIGNRIRFKRKIKKLPDPPFKIDLSTKPPYDIKEEPKVKVPYGFVDDKELKDPPFKIKESMNGLWKMYVEADEETEKWKKMEKIKRERRGLDESE
jgi:hypothetical protein